MVEIIINYTTQAGLVGLAQSLGYVTIDPVSQKPVITATGAIDSGGSYFFNNIGPVVATPATYDNTVFPPTLLTPAVMAPGLWGRLRHNGDPAALAAKVPNAATLASFGVTIYPNYPDPLGWSADGVTPAPGYVANIGVIA